MIPLDSPHAWDAHGRAWEVIHSRGTPSLPTGCPTATPPPPPGGDYARHRVTRHDPCICNVLIQTRYNFELFHSLIGHNLGGGSRQPAGRGARDTVAQLHVIQNRAV